MKISELIQRTGVSKETIHYYIREGVLHRPRKTGRNSAEYNESHVERIRTIKALRENYYLPIPVIKKLITKHKKQSGPEKSSFQFLSENVRPIDQLISGEVAGRETFLKTTGLGEKWLAKMEKWGVITPHQRNGQSFYSQDNVIIAKLLVEMDRIGVGPRDGFDPGEIRNFTDMFRQLVAKNVARFMELGWDKVPIEERRKKGGESTELMSLFFYHIYRKLVKEEYRRYLDAHNVKEE